MNVSEELQKKMTYSLVFDQITKHLSDKTDTKQWTNIRQKSDRVEKNNIFLMIWSISNASKDFSRLKL